MRPIHHVGFNVPDLHTAIDTWVNAYGAAERLDAFFATIAGGA